MGQGRHGGTEVIQCPPDEVQFCKRTLRVVRNMTLSIYSMNGCLLRRRKDHAISQVKMGHCELLKCRRPVGCGVSNCMWPHASHHDAGSFRCLPVSLTHVHFVLTTFAML